MFWIGLVIGIIVALLAVAIVIVKAFSGSIRW